ncbi:hypothetical protein ACEWY4_018688 [Coilia grayii]|uniref:Collagenase NC10/endostatin domain-containing protein n=1 Tax=Coilia grayii TaxID=363190 RepID=A0ABD1JH17_9TELE
MPSRPKPSCPMPSRPMPSCPMPSRPMPSCPSPSHSVPLDSEEASRPRPSTSSCLYVLVPCHPVPCHPVPAHRMRSLCTLRRRPVLVPLRPRPMPSCPMPSCPMPSCPSPSHAVPLHSEEASRPRPSTSSSHAILSHAIPSHAIPRPCKHPGAPLEILKLVALNTPLTGNIGSLTAADQACRAQAQAMGIRDQYRAFLSNHLQDLVDIIHPQYRRNLPIVNLRGEVLFDNYEHIFTKNSALPHGIPLFSFDGRDVMSDPFWPQKAIWHGSSPQGRRLQEKTCESWRAGDMAIVGQASFLYSGLLTQHSRSCSNQFIVLCVETSPEPSPTYQEARRGTRYAYYYYRNPLSSQRT